MRNFRATGRVLNLVVLLALLVYPDTVTLAEPGFWGIDSVDIPGVVKEKALSVYQMIVLSPSGHEVLSRDGYAEVLSKEKGCLEADIKKRPTQVPSGDLGRYYQIASCIIRGEEECKLYETIALGTAFEASLCPDVSGLWTTYRNVKGAIERYLEKEGERVSDKKKESEIPLNILLINKDKEVVLDTRVEGRRARIVDFVHDIGVVRIQLSQKVGKPLLFGQCQGLTEGAIEDIYIMAFPVVQRDETRREDYYASSLKRYELSVTIGEIFLRPAHSRPGPEIKDVECDADSAPGMSGAPALNEHGEVVGIFIRPMAFKVGSVLTPSDQVHNYFGDESATGL
jgi:hypothetical protein